MTGKTAVPARLLSALLIAGCVLCGAPAASGQEALERARTLVSERRDAGAAQQLLRAILAQDPRQPEANYLLAGVLYDFRRYDEAEPFAERAAALAPRDSRARLLLGKVTAARIQKAGLLSKVELLRKARAEFEAAVAADPHSIPARRALAGLLADAPGMLGGSLDGALEQAAAIAGIDAAEGHLVRADLYGAQKRLPEAEQECRRAVAAAGRRADVHARAGTLLLLYGRRAAAWPYFEAALSLDPRQPVAAYQLARRAIETGQDLERAEPLLRLNLERWPQEEGVSWGHTHWRLGELYARQGKREQAVQELEAALEQRPDLKGAREDLDRLRRNVPVTR